MLNKLTAFMDRYTMVSPGDTVICAVSGGPDSMALLWAMYLLREKLQLTVEAAHFNHGLRGAESDRDEAFVRQFCKGYEIPFHCGSAQVVAGPKGLEAAARDARYAYLKEFPGKIATAHNADDNAETVLMHLVRGTGLKGLGGITPVRDKLIRPMLTVTRQEILDFLEEYSISYVEDSTNISRDFLRNRIRHSVMPLLKEENPRISQNLSGMALRLRQDEEVLEQMAQSRSTTDIRLLRQMEPALRNRVLSKLLVSWGVKEPEAIHVAELTKLVFSDNPSAKASFSDAITVQRVYNHLTARKETEPIATYPVQDLGVTTIPELGLQVVVTPAGQEGESISPAGQMVIRCRQTGDTIRLAGGTKSLKKLFIDRKIPAAQRDRIPVLADEKGVLAVFGFGVNRARQENATVTIQIKPYNPAKS